MSKKKDIGSFHFWDVLLDLPQKLYGISVGIDFEHKKSLFPSYFLFFF